MITLELKKKRSFERLKKKKNKQNPLTAITLKSPHISPPILHKNAHVHATPPA